MGCVTSVRISLATNADTVRACELDRSSIMVAVCRISHSIKVLGSWRAINITFLWKPVRLRASSVSSTLSRVSFTMLLVVCLNTLIIASAFTESNRFHTALGRWRITPLTHFVAQGHDLTRGISRSSKCLATFTVKTNSCDVLELYLRYTLTKINEVELR